MTAADLARLGLVLAETMDRAGNPTSAGIVRRLAGLVVELAADDPYRSQAPDCCPICGATVAQPARGRRRVYCTDEHRREAQRRQRARNARNETMGA